MIPRMASVTIALIVPGVLLITGILLLGSTPAKFLGIPAVLAFMFAMFPFMSLAMWISWRLFDKDAGYQLDDVDEQTGEMHS